MRDIEQWKRQTDGEQIRVDHFIRVSYRWMKRTIKGASLHKRKELGDAINDGITCFILWNGMSDFQLTNTGDWMSVSVCPSVFEEVQKAVNRIYARHRRREQLLNEARDQHSLVRASESAEVKQAQQLLNYINRLPDKRLADVLRAICLAAEYCPNESQAEFVMKRLNLGKSTYHLRRQQAAEQLRRILEADGWHLPNWAKEEEDKP